MTYNPTVPGPAQRISDTQSPIQTNFDQLNVIFGLDHFEFDATSENGKHKSVTLPDQDGSPPATAVDEMAIYARTSDSETFPFMRRDTSTTDIPLLPIKAFGECSVPGAVLTANSFNISSVTRIGTGRYDFNFTDPLPDTDYTVLCAMSSSGSQPIISYENSNKLTTSCRIQLIRQDGAGFTDSATLISVTILRA